MQDYGGCEGCKQAAIFNATAETRAKQNAKKHCDEQKRNTIVWHNGQEYGWCEESAFVHFQPASVIAIYTTHHKNNDRNSLY